MRTTPSGRPAPGLAVIDAVGRLATQEPLKVRIGIASGLVVVGDLIGAGAAQERGVVGETPNLAARLQALVRPSTLVVADGDIGLDVPTERHYIFPSRR